jgi:hypothetical protein
MNTDPKKGYKEDIDVITYGCRNKPNWFGGVSPSMKTTQTSSRWEYYFGSSIGIRFPIACK